MNATSTDRIEKQILIQAPLARVWQALTDHQEFGTWFRAELHGPFVPGQKTTGRSTYPGYEHVPMILWVERMDAPTYFSFRWHPYDVDPNVDNSAEETTLVEFRLAEESGATRLVVSESGFDQLPAERRDEAFRMNEGGWAEQVLNIQRHVAG
jgi:uncharacterized protein YndB with AHSA1/START domain